MSDIQNSVLAVLLPLVKTFLDNVSANPDPKNIIAQLTVLQVQFVAALPNIQQGVTASVIAELKAKVDEAIANLGK